MSERPTVLGARARQRFIDMMGRPARVVVAAPGRVNLIGDHTDYQGGLALPMAIERWLTVAAAPRPGPPGSATIWTGFGDQLVRIEPDYEPAEHTWANYVAGVLRLGARQGVEPPAFDAVVHSDVPVGAGLSSSAALEVAFALVTEALSGTPRRALDRARLCRKAEHEYANVPCGPMDQIAVAMAQPGQALFLDCGTERFETVPVDSKAVDVLVLDSGVRHELADGEYAHRRVQCQRAAQRLEVRNLAGVTVADLQAARKALDSTLFRRARHVVTENERTLQMVQALRAGNFTTAGQLMYESHRSLSEDFEVGCPELDTLVRLAAQEAAAGLYGARMTGGGFGGSIVALVEHGRGSSIGDRIGENYQRQTGRTTHAFTTGAAGAARVVAPKPPSP